MEGEPGKAARELASKTKPINRRALIAGASAAAIANYARGESTLQIYPGRGEQDQWRFCWNCFGMFYEGPRTDRSVGVCPAGGHHQPQGFNFIMHYDDARGPSGTDPVQYDWRFCEKCWVMFYNGGGGAQGVCSVQSGPGGRAHWPRGFLFGVPFNQPVRPGMQEGWAFCDKCWALYFNQGSGKAHCPAGGGHHPASNTFNFMPRFNGSHEQWIDYSPPSKPCSPYGFAKDNVCGVGSGPPPKIAVTASGGSLRVTGSGFVPNGPATVRVVIGQIGNDAYWKTAADGAGRLDLSNIPCVGGNFASVTATSGVRSGGDLTGSTWSNNVTLACR